MDALATLIQQERAKLRLLEAEVAARRQRVETLEAMRDGSDLDAVLSSKLASFKDRATLTVFNQPCVVTTSGRRRKGEVRRAVLGLLNQSTYSHLTTMLADLEKAGIVIDNKRLRAELWGYKNNGLVESNEPGFYRVTEKGIALLARESESPGGSGLSGATASEEDDEL